MIKQNLPGDGLKLTSKRAEESALAASTCTHHADHLPAFDAEIKVIERRVTAAEAAQEIACFQRPDDVAFLFDDPIGEIAPENLSRIDADRVTIDQCHGSADRDAAHDDRSVRLKHFDTSGLFLVITVDLQRDFPADSG